MESFFITTILEDWQYRIFCLGKGLFRLSKKKWLCCGSFANSRIQICFDRSLDIASSTKKAIWCLYMLFNLSFLLSNHFSFQRQECKKLQRCLGVLFQLQIIFPIGKLTIFILEKWVVWRWKSFYLFSQFILVMCSYVLIKYFIYFIATTLLFLRFRLMLKRKTWFHCSSN